MLLKRGKVFYFRWQIPKDLRSLLGNSELVKSLKTKKYHEATKKALKIRLLVGCILRVRKMCKSSDDENETKLVINEVLKTLYSSVKSEMDALEFDSHEELLEFKCALESMVSRFGRALKTKKLKLTRDGPSEIEILRGLLPHVPDPLHRELFETMEGTFSEGAYTGILANYISILQKVYVDKLEELETDNYELPDYLIDVLDLDGDEKSSSILFSEVHAQFIQHKIKVAQLSEKMQKDYERYLNDWLDLMGDIPVTDITTKDVKAFALSLAQLPKRNLKPYKGRLASELLELSIPKGDQASPALARGGVKWLQGAFVYAKDQGFVENSPANNIKLDLERSKPYSSYSNSQVRFLLEAVSDEKKSFKKWIVWLAAYSGLRLGEIIQLRKSDICKDDDSQRLYIRVTGEGEGQSVKTEAGNRQVPVHKMLLEAGFTEYVDSTEDNLFPDLASKSITQWFSGFRKLCEIPKYNDFGQRYVFHSFRHTVVTMARGKGVPDVNVQQVIGHEKVGAGVTDRYTHSRPLKDVLEVIDCLDYS